MVAQALQNVSGNKVRALQEVILLCKSAFKYQRQGNQFALMAGFLLNANTSVSLHQILFKNQKEVLVRFFLASLQKDIQTLMTNRSSIEPHQTSPEQSLSLLDFYTICFDTFDPFTGHLANKVIEILHSLICYVPQHNQSEVPDISDPFALVQFYCNAQKSVSKNIFKEELHDLVKAKLLANQKTFIQDLAEDIASKGISPHNIKKDWLMGHFKSKYDSVLSAIENRIICERLFAFQSDYITLKQLSNDIAQFEDYLQILQTSKISLSLGLSAAYLGLHFHFKKTIIRYLSIFKRFDKVDSGIHKLNKFNHFFEYFKLISPSMSIAEANKLFSLTSNQKFIKKKEVKMHSILEQAAREGFVVGLKPNTLKCKSNSHLLKSENISIKVASPSESMESTEHQKKKCLKSKMRSLSIRVGSAGHKHRVSILRFPKKRPLV